MLEAKNLNFTYPGSNQKRLQDLSFTLPDQAKLGILGLNGCGKTTLLKVLAGLLKPTSGQVFWQQKDLESHSAIERAKFMAYLPQDFPLAYPFTVKQLVLMGRYPHRQGFFDSAKDFEMAHQALQKFGIEDLAERSILTLSGGQRQKAILARTWVQEAKWILFDEPFHHLDIKAQMELSDFMAGLDQGWIAVLHDLCLAEKLCDHLLLIKDGQLVAFGDTKTVLNNETLSQTFGMPVERFSYSAAPVANP